MIDSLFDGDFAVVLRFLIILCGLKASTNDDISKISLYIKEREHMNVGEL